MRLNNYINETTEGITSLAKLIVTSMLNNIWLDLKKINFRLKSDKQLIDIMNKHNKYPDYVEFALSNKKRKSLSRIVSIGIFDMVEKNKIIINVRKDVYKFFDRFAKPNGEKIWFDLKKNQLTRDLISALSHEIIHSLQYLKSEGLANFPSNAITSVYISGHVEIEAFAAQAAVDLITTGKSKFYDLYKELFEEDEISRKTWNKFLKKLDIYKKEIKNSDIFG